jgi:hypothetical protein
MTSLPIIMKTQLIGSWWPDAGLRAGARLPDRAPPGRLAGGVRAEVDLPRAAEPFDFPLDVRVAMIRG